MYRWKKSNNTDISRRKAKGRLLSRFTASDRGTVAIEFAALAIPFSLLVFAILESCISFAAQQVLANTADDIARQIRTGQVKAADLNESKLKEMVCGDLDIIVSSGCPGLEVDLKEYASFSAAAAVTTKYTADNDIDTTGFAVTPGKSGTKNMLRVYYRWPVMTDLMRKSMSNLKDDKTLLFATVTWQNEPFED